MPYFKEAVPGDEMCRCLNGFVAALGALVAASPFFLSFSENVAATANALLCGMAVVILAVVNRRDPRPWAEWSALALGLWIVVSPWLLQSDVVPWTASGDMGGFAPEVSAHIAFGLALLFASAFVIARSGVWPITRSN